MKPYTSHRFGGRSFGPLSSAILVLRYGRYYLRQKKTPYSKGIDLAAGSGGNLGVMRRQSAVLRDSLINVLLDAYSDLTGLRLSPASGGLFVRLLLLAESLDDSFERNMKAGHQPELANLLAEPEVAQKRKAFREFLQGFGMADRVLPHLRKALDHHFTRYEQLSDFAVKTLSFQHTLQVIHLDSGEFSRAIIEAIALFNRHTYSQNTVDQFRLYGIAGKLADDLVDLGRDVEDRSPNLLWALLSENDAEWKTWRAATQSQIRLNLRWWRKNCPNTIARYERCFLSYYKRLRSAKLRLACDLMLLPWIYGFDYNRKRQGAM